MRLKLHQLQMFRLAAKKANHVGLERAIPGLHAVIKQIVDDHRQPRRAHGPKAAEQPSLRELLEKWVDLDFDE